MRLCVIDFETYWSATHSLTKMDPISYVMHPDTEIVSVAAKFDDKETQVLFGEDNIRSVLSRIDWSDTLVVGHNMSGFDSLLLAWRFGVKPKMWGCTLAMSRPFFQTTAAGSLKKVAAALGVGEKGSLEATNTKGKRLEDFTEREREAMAEYNKLDVDLCYGIFKKLAPRMSKMEMQLIDLTTRMLVEPTFVLDTALLERTLEKAKQDKVDMLRSVASQIGVDTSIFTTDEEVVENASKILASAAKFSELLRSRGVEVPMKPSPTNPEKQTPALAKTDEAFIALQDHEDEVVSLAARARLGVKSTLLETRVEKFLGVGKALGGLMPIFLNYYAATTGRWGGGGSLNQQNLPRVSGKPTDALRKSLRAPEGHKVVVCDLSGIELRVNHFLWQVPSSMALYQADPVKADLYKDFASKLYNVDVASVTKAQRQVGKVAHLGLGFGSGAKTFQKVAKLMGGVEITEEESTEIVAKWRQAYIEIKNGWRLCGNAVTHTYNGDYGLPIDPWGLCVTHEEGIKTPVGMIRYPKLEFVEDEKSFYYGEGRNRARLTGPKCDENIVQHLARCIMAEQLLKISKQYKVVHTVHDEVVCIVPENRAQACLDFMIETMSTPPTWWSELVLSAEGDIADSYGEAKS